MHDRNNVESYREDKDKPEGAELLASTASLRSELATPARSD